MLLFSFLRLTYLNFRNIHFALVFNLISLSQKLIKSRQLVKEGQIQTFCDDDREKFYKTKKTRMVSINVPLCVIINEAQIGRMGSVSTFHH